MPRMKKALPTDVVRLKSAAETKVQEDGFMAVVSAAGCPAREASRIAGPCLRQLRARVTNQNVFGLVTHATNVKLRTLVFLHKHATLAM